MLDMENNVSECIKEAIPWDLNIKLMNDDEEIQW